jgi:hypothetical protein
MVMAKGSIITNLGKQVVLRRSYTENGDLPVGEWLAPTRIKLGIENTTPAVTDTDVDRPIPISPASALDDGSNTMTGSGGGSDTTTNTTFFKQGANQADLTAQNLIANSSSATKVWAISDLSASGSVADSAKRVAFWLRIFDQDTLDKLSPTGSFELRLGSDSSNYYSLSWDAADLVVGWNWMSSGYVDLGDLTETGTVSGSIEYFELRAVTTLAESTFTTNDLVYDLLHQWSDSDLYRGLEVGYPDFDDTKREVTFRFRIPTTQANGFSLNGLGFFNEDDPEKLFGHDTFTDEGKTDTEELVFVLKDRVL